MPATPAKKVLKHCLVRSVRFGSWVDIFRWIGGGENDLNLTARQNSFHCT
jgi:hypothetical protein